MTKKKLSSRGGKRENSGRKPIEFSLAEHYLVASLCLQGVNHEIIMSVLAQTNPAAKGKALGKATFYKEFKQTIADAKSLTGDIANAQVVSALFKNAVENDNFQAQKHWLAKRMPEDWDDTEKIQVENRGEREINVTFEMGEPPAWAKQRAEENRRKMEEAGIDEDD